MKKLFALLLALAVVGSIALADPASLTDCSVSSGVVNAVNYIDITAPFSGTLQPFTWEAGDLVNAGDLLFSMRTTTIYATEDATVQAIYCAVGDDAAAVATRFSVQYNRVRQASITQEITEVSSGAKAQKRKKVQSC